MGKFNLKIEQDNGKVKQIISKYFSTILINLDRHDIELKLKEHIK